MPTLPRHLRSLPRLMAVADGELADRTFLGRAALIAKLECVLQAERRRGLARHWSYELARHTAPLPSTAGSGMLSGATSGWRHPPQTRARNPAARLSLVRPHRRR